MKSKKIFLIRHGQTEYNKKGMVQGSGIDASLNEKGKWQAAEFWEHYKDYPFERVYTSALIRTKQTVARFIEKGIPHIEFDGLNEIHWGTKEGKVATTEDKDDYMRVTKAWQNGELHVKIEGGESPLDLKKKQEVVLEYLKNEEEGEHILICMHGRAMRILLCIMTECSIAEMDRFEHDNTSLYILNYANNRFELEASCNLDHLSGKQFVETKD